jgi:hypothetical protein
MINGISFAQGVAIAAGFCSGGILGAFVTTKTEVDKRWGWQPQHTVHESLFERLPFGYLLSACLRIILMAVLWVLTSFVIMRLGGLSRLDRMTKGPYGLGYLVGIFAGKGARYLYLKLKK